MFAQCLVARWLDGSHRKMRLPPVARTASQSGRRARDRRPNGPVAARPAPAGAAPLPQSRLSVPSRGRTNSGANGRARLWPGTTNDAQTKLWKHSAPQPARRAGHYSQCSPREGECPEPSNVANAYPSKHRIRDGAPDPPGARNDCRRHAVGVLRRHAVQHSADVVAARIALDAERRLHVRDAPTH